MLCKNARECLFAIVFSLVASAPTLAQKPIIAVFSGPTATIQNSQPLVTSNKAREKYASSTESMGEFRLRLSSRVFGHENPILNNRSSKSSIEPVEMGLGTVCANSGQMVRQRCCFLEYGRPVRGRTQRRFGDRSPTICRDFVRTVRRPFSYG